MKTDWEDVVAVLVFFALFILCVGEPDILDGLIARANNVAVCGEDK